ncbi:MAG: M48 family metallopeptidase [Gammaproteobacteria bacterium]|nr:M48 family metallopeptidase [Gammaproteobacteria bacterium]MCP4831623.1 M48 family metallopeptidase [Gammaproteobacteria bacterium]
MTLVTSTVFVSAPNAANIDELPDIGSPSDAILSRKIESHIGRQVYYTLLESGKVVTDPEIQEYIQSVGMELVAHAGIDGQRFQFFVMNDPVINAFALPGGYIGVHTGLLLATDNESELAGVLAHEISHVTQRHISRAVFANQANSTLSMAALLGAILVGVATGADPGMISGAVGASQGMAMEAQIGFTRSNEYEADRVGVGVLADAGFDPMGMPDFFETMGRASGSLSGNRIPEFLLTHPMSSDRMAESRARAQKYPIVETNDSNGYEIARARIRLLTSSRPEAALEQFKQLQNSPDKAGKLEIEYGVAIANMQMGNYKTAEGQLTTLLSNNEEIIPLHSALAISQAKTGDTDKALTTFETAMQLFPRNVPLTVHYCEMLINTGHATKAHEILLDLLNQVPPTQEQVRLIAIAANTAGDTAEANYYMAEYHAMSGSLLLAIEQLKLALSTPGLDNVDRARFTTRLNEFQSYLPDRNKQKDKKKENNQ